LNQAVEGGVVIGGTVSFIVEVNKDGKPQARDVRLEDTSGAGAAHHGNVALGHVPCHEARQGQKHRGHVKSFNAARGFGFIVCPDLQPVFEGGDIYVSKTQLGENRITTDQVVEFNLHVDRKGKPQARDVVVVLSKNKETSSFGTGGWVGIGAQGGHYGNDIGAGGELHSAY